MKSNDMEKVIQAQTILITDLNKQLMKQTALINSIIDAKGAEKKKNTSATVSEEVPDYASVYIEVTNKRYGMRPDPDMGWREDV